MEGFCTAKRQAKFESVGQSKENTPSWKLYFCWIANDDALGRWNGVCSLVQLPTAASILTILTNGLLSDRRRGPPRSVEFFLLHCLICLLIQEIWLQSAPGVAFSNTGLSIEYWPEWFQLCAAKRRSGSFVKLAVARVHACKFTYSPLKRDFAACSNWYTVGRGSFDDMRDSPYFNISMISSIS